VLEVVRKEPPKPESAIVKASEIKTTENTNATFFSSYDSSDFGKY
jgi:ribosomal protein S12